MDKDSILASLTGDQIGRNDSTLKIDNSEQDLFGDIAVHEASSHAAPVNSGGELGNPTPSETSSIQKHNQVSSYNEPLTGSGQIAPHSYMPGSNPVSAPPAPPVPNVLPVESLLSKSGLLGMSGMPGNSSGLFDEVDPDEQKETESNLTANQQQVIRNEKTEARQKQDTEANSKGADESFQMQKQQQNLTKSLYNHDSMQPNVRNSLPPDGQQFVAVQDAVMPQGQLNSQMSSMTLKNSDATGFYREHHTPTNQSTLGVGMSSPSGNGGHGAQNIDGYFYGTREQKAQQSFLPGSSMQPSSVARMHNYAQNTNLGRMRKVEFVKPQEVPPLYVDIRVTEPMLIQTQSFLISSPPYWSYQITSQLSRNLGTWLVRRRFRHVVALEDRLRQACPGSIIPPRPEKHATRALEEASTQQSAEFAVQRSKELEVYLNQLARHPVAGQSQVLRLFLGLQDDIGTAWPEVSTNALTRLQAVGAGVTMRVAESTNLTAASAPAHEWEEDAELLSLCSSENLRLGAVSQAVPKLEGSVIVLREQGDAAGILGMELSKASKTLDLDYKFYDILSSGLLRHGRRTKRLALEMSAAMESFIQQYKLVRYEKMAMQDRRHAIQRKAKERGRADARAAHLGQQQRQLQIHGQMHHLNQLEHSAISMDTQALDAVNEADQIGARLKLEINRVAIDRRIAWNNSIKAIASSMKDSCSERLAIWESTLEAFESLPNDAGHL